MTKMDTMPARWSTPTHDHEWRRRSSAMASVYEYWCKDCSVVWSGYMETIDDPARLPLKRG